MLLARVLGACEAVALWSLLDQGPAWGLPACVFWLPAPTVRPSKSSPEPEPA